MMRAKADPRATSNTLYVVASILLAGSLVGLALPKPSARKVQDQAKKDTKAEAKKKRDAEAAAAVAKASVFAATWSEEPSLMKGQIVNLTSELAKRRNVKWVRLTPPVKSNVDGSLEQYPFMLVVEGRFLDVAALERDLENPENRLAINSFQATSASTETDDVSASIGFVAHRIVADESVGKETKNAKHS